MKKLFLLFVAFVATTSLWAYDLVVDGIYYNYLEDNNVEVTYRGIYSSTYDEYAGEVTIPSTVTNNGTTYSVTSIGGEAFGHCSKLTAITIPNSVKSIGDRAFSWCSNLLDITIPNSVTTVGGGMFYGCSNLKSVVLSNNITSLPSCYDFIAYGFFGSCSSLTSITIPNSVTSIGSSAFSGCSSLITVICEAVEVPELGSYVFSNTPITEATLYVPEQSLDDYKAAYQWKDFGSILPLEAPSAVENTRLPIANGAKLLRNGQVYILQDGNTYNMMGQKIGNL